MTPPCPLENNAIIWFGKKKPKWPIEAVEPSEKRRERKIPAPVITRSLFYERLSP
jgi:hypothetical protein